MFFRIERSGPLGGGPARANPHSGSASRAMITASYRGNGCVSFARQGFPYFRTFDDPLPAFCARFARTTSPCESRVCKTERKQNLRSFLSSSISSR